MLEFAPAGPEAQQFAGEISAVTEQEVDAVRQQAEDLLDQVDALRQFNDRLATDFRDQIQQELDVLGRTHEADLLEAAQEAETQFISIQESLDAELALYLPGDVGAVAGHAESAPAVSPEAAPGTVEKEGQRISEVIQALLQKNSTLQAMVAQHYGLNGYDAANDPDCMKLLTYLFPWRGGTEGKAAGDPRVTLDGIDDKQAIHTPQVGDTITIHPDGRIQVVRPGQPVAEEAAQPAASAEPEPLADAAAAAEGVATDSTLTVPPEALESNTRASIAANLENPPGDVRFTYFTAEGEVSFEFHRGLIQVQRPGGNVETYALYNLIDLGRAGGELMPPLQGQKLYVRDTPLAPGLGVFESEAAAKEIWFHGPEPTKKPSPTDNAIGITPAKLYALATQIVQGQVVQSQTFTGAEKYTKAQQGHARPEPYGGMSSQFVLERVSHGPAGYNEVAEFRRDGQPTVRVYAPANHRFAPQVDERGRDKGYLVKVGNTLVEAKRVKDDKTGNTLVTFKLPDSKKGHVLIPKPTDEGGPADGKPILTWDEEVVIGDSADPAPQPPVEAAPPPARRG